MVLREMYRHFFGTAGKIIYYLRYEIEIMSGMMAVHGDDYVSVIVFLRHSIHLPIFDENSSHFLTYLQQSVSDLSRLHFLFPNQSIVFRR